MGWQWEQHCRLGRNPGIAICMKAGIPCLLPCKRERELIMPR
jgi:hypothetical protein